MIIKLTETARIKLPLLDMIVKRRSPLQWAGGGHLGFYCFEMLLPGFDSHVEDLWSSLLHASR